MINNFIKTKNEKIILKIKERFEENKYVFEEFFSEWYEILEIFFDEKKYWDYFYILQEEETIIFELLENKKAKLNLVFAFLKEDSIFYFKVLF